MFDSVYAKCPNYGNNLEFQNKAVLYELKRYTKNSIPPEVAQDLQAITKVYRICEKKFFFAVK